MDEVAVEEISLGYNSYPNRLLRCLGKQAPPQIAILGSNTLLLATNKTVALMCSAKAPASILLTVHDLAHQWRHRSQIIISGSHSSAEQETFEILLRGPGKVITARRATRPHGLNRPGALSWKQVGSPCSPHSRMR